MGVLTGLPRRSEKVTYLDIRFQVSIFGEDDIVVHRPRYEFSRLDSPSFETGVLGLSP